MRKRIGAVALATLALGVGTASAADTDLFGLLGDDPIVIDKGTLRGELEKHLSFAGQPPPARLPREPVSRTKCLAPQTTLQALDLVKNVRSKRRLVTLYRTTTGGYVRQVCSRGGRFRSLVASAPFETPGGRVQLRTDVARKVDGMMRVGHFDYSRASVAQAWRDPRQRRKMLRWGNVR